MGAVRWEGRCAEVCDNRTQRTLVTAAGNRFPCGMHCFTSRHWRFVPARLSTICLALGLMASGSHAQEYLVYFGTYTGKKSKGIYVSRMNLATGRLGDVDLAVETPSPSFLAVHPTGRFVYAANEVSQHEGKPTGAVTAFSVDPRSGRLTQLDQESSGGAGPCHLVVDRTGRAVLVANYGGGSVAALPIARDGRLSPASAFLQHTGSSVNAARQKEPHAHSINIDEANRYAIAADLGLDKLLVYRFNPEKGTLVPNASPYALVRPGSGPRHFAFHPKRKYAYVINEMTCTVTAFRYVPRTGELFEEQTVSTLPKEEKMKPSYSTAEIQVHPSGNFVYGSNRGHDTIAVFSADRSGRLTLVENVPTGGKTPRNFGIDPTGKFLLAANQSSDSVVVFSIDPKSGRLTPTGQTLEVGSPVCVKFIPVR
jgi:6-phosphogluconolactonase